MIHIKCRKLNSMENGWLLCKLLLGPHIMLMILKAFSKDRVSIFTLLYVLVEEKPGQKDCALKLAVCYEKLHESPNKLLILLS